MNWREFLGSAVRELEAVLRDDRSARVAAMSGLVALVAISLLTVLATRLRRRRQPAVPMALDQAFGIRDLGDWGLGGNSDAATSPEAPLRRWPIDRVLPHRILGTVALAIVVAAAVWLTGLCLAPNVAKFLASPEWHFQPLYIAAHIIAVRMFVLAYARGFERGVAHLAIPVRQTRTLVDRLLGVTGGLLALVLAMPFIALDFLYLFSDRYARMGGPEMVLPIDYLMWGIWSVEWFLNAFIWVVLVGFLIKTWWVVRNFPFRAPIEIVLHDRQYKPFLQMSAQGASIVFAFTVVTVAYIWYTGGELTDYVGLVVTAMLLVVGFLPSWLLLRAKVRRAVEIETLAMRRRLLRNLEAAEAEASDLLGRDPSRPETDVRSLQHRLDAAVAILRISYLEGRHQTLGASEARAVLIRMLAPAASIGWQLAKSYGHLLSDVQAHLMKLM